MPVTSATRLGDLKRGQLPPFGDAPAVSSRSTRPGRSGHRLLWIAAALVLASALVLIAVVLARQLS